MNPLSLASSRWRAVRVGGGVALVAAMVGVAAAADWQSLTGNSPFGQAPTNAPAQPGGELEFRGVVREDDITLVNIFNTSTQKSQWIPLQGQANGIAADSYDASSDKVQVTMGGKALTLPLKQSRVTLVQSAPPPPVGAPVPNGPPNGNPGGGGGNVATAQGGPPPAPGSPDAQQAFRNLPPEARNMIEEIRRRRAQRAQAANPNPSTAPKAPNAAPDTTPQP